MRKEKEENQFANDGIIQQKKKDIREWIKWACTWILAGILLLYITWLCLTEAESEFLCYLFGIPGAIALAVGIMSVYFALKCNDELAERKYEIVERKRQIEEREKQVKEKNAQVKEGKWKFPSVRFYELCKEAHIYALADDFSITKAKQFARQIMSEEKIDWENQIPFLQVNKLREAFDEGRGVSDKAEAERIERAKNPRNASPNIPERNFLKRASEIKSCSENSKRIMMLRNLLDDCDSRIRQISEGEEAMKQLSAIYLGAQRKEESWGLAGGIAEGIAGPTAGVMAAVNTMGRNREIQAYNQSMREASMGALKGAFSMSSDKYKLQSERETIQAKLAEAGKKITLKKPNAREIFSNMEIGKAKIEKGQTNVLHIELPVSLKTAFELSAPKDVMMVVDGTLQGEIWYEDRCVDSVVFPFPLYGIPTGMTQTVTLDAMCGKYVELEGEYTLKLAKYQKLWIMEA